MSLLRPDARGARILDNGDALDPIEAAFAAFLNDEPGASEAVRTAYELYDTPARHVLNALLLVRTDPVRIQADLGLDAEALAAYQHLFFDTKIFRNVFAAHAYMNQLQPDNTEEFQAYQFARSHGGEALLARYRLGEPGPIDEEQLAARALSELSTRMTEHRAHSLTSAAARESLRMAQAVLNGATSMRGLRPPKSNTVEHAFELALIEQTHSSSVSSSPVPPEELIRSAPKPKGP